MFKITSLTLAILFLIVLGVSRASLPRQVNAQQATKKADATHAEEGVMTERQKQHSKLYKNFRSEKKLRDLAAVTHGDVGIERGIPDRTFSPDAPPFNFNKFLKDSVCKADAVVIGVVQDKSSQLTEDEDFIFTDYVMSVEEILKNNQTAPIQSAREIIITRPGGTIQLDGRNISALDQALEPFEVGGRYLLFLEFIPATNSYKAFNSQGSFLLNDKKIMKLTKESLPRELESGNDSVSLVTKLRNIIAGSCNP